MTSDELKTAATGFLPGAVVGAAIVWLAMSMAPGPVQVPLTLPSDTQDSTTETDKSPTPDTAQKSSPSGARVKTDDQPAGRAAMIKSVSLEATSWIAIRDYSDGKIGNVLGAVRREKGESTNVVIDLLRATEPGKQYAIVIFAENGDGTFSTKTDTPVLAGTDAVHATFTAQTPVAPNGR